MISFLLWACFGIACLIATVFFCFLAWLAIGHDKKHAQHVDADSHPWPWQHARRRFQAAVTGGRDRLDELVASFVPAPAASLPGAPHAVAGTTSVTAQPPPMHRAVTLPVQARAEHAAASTVPVPGLDGETLTPLPDGVLTYIGGDVRAGYVFEPGITKPVAYYTGRTEGQRQLLWHTHDAHTGPGMPADPAGYTDTGWTKRSAAQLAAALARAETDAGFASIRPREICEYAFSGIQARWAS